MTRIPRRHSFSCLQRAPGARDLEIRLALSFRQRLRGILAWPDWEQGTWGLLFPRCKAVHTFGMRSPIDVVFVSRAGHPLRVCAGLPPRSWAAYPRSWGVLELPAGYCSASDWARRVSDAWDALKIEV